MNYALDALWWKLQTPAVRDLAVLLTAPPPWLSGAELPVRTLLGEDGFRYLLALDDNPAPLQHFLQTHAPFGRRLGVYAEQLLAFWLAHAPHTRLLAHNLPVLAANGQTAVNYAHHAFFNPVLAFNRNKCSFCEIAPGVSPLCKLKCRKFRRTLKIKAVKFYGAVIGR